LTTADDFTDLFPCFAAATFQPRLVCLISLPRRTNVYLGRGLQINESTRRVALASPLQEFPRLQG